MAIFWERAAHSLNRLFSLYYIYVGYFLFSFEDKTLVLIAPVPGHCVRFYFWVVFVECI